MAYDRHNNSVLLIDDHPLFRQGLRHLIEEGGRYTVVAEAASGYEAIRLADIHNPRLILSDIQLRGITGLKVARVLKKQHPKSQIVFLSMHVDDDRLLEAVRAGASAFVTKDTDAGELLRIIDTVMAGEQPIYSTVLSRPHLAWRVLAELRSSPEEAPPRPQPMPLSTREIEVLDCVAQGLSNKEVADALYITEQTVKNHMTSVLRKLEVTDRVQAVLFAVKHGWVEIGSSGVAA
jgi:DNA-binding NarL/FixJ family response regulator